jgi:hypothetical protein
LGQRRKKLLAATILSLAPLLISSPALAKPMKLTAKMVAYNLMKHASKDATYEQNQEVVILQTIGPKQKYVKVVFSSFGTTQIDPKYFNGTLPLDVEVFRDHSCDEIAPAFAAQTGLEQIAGTYLLTDAFKNNPPPRLKNLVCYDAIYRKKK